MFNWLKKLNIRRHATEMDLHLTDETHTVIIDMTFKEGALLDICNVIKGSKLLKQKRKAKGVNNDK